MYPSQVQLCIGNSRNAKGVVATLMTVTSDYLSVKSGIWLTVDAPLLPQKPCALFTPAP